ncbi:exodeoxyribonuclease V subunit beta [Parasalinivibrio latis]
MQVQPLDPMIFPLHGARLIEASAGTGKTFTLAALYLRLLLGHGNDDHAFERPLGVSEILVVTFTEAATQELRDRIRARIHQARLAFLQGESTDPVISALLASVDDHKSAANLLLQAEQQMDEAAVYTIHGFCQRMLTQNAFESGSLFNQQFVTDEQPLRLQAVADFWRRHFYPLPKALASVIRSIWASPEKLLEEVSPYLSGPAVKIEAPEIEGSLENLHKQQVARIAALKSAWCEAAPDLEALITASGVDKRSYSKKNLPNWLKSVGNWAISETTDYGFPEALEKFSQPVLDEKTKKGETPVHPVFSDIAAFLASPPGIREAVTAWAIRETRILLAQEKRRQGWLSFDDLLSRLAGALRQPQGPVLAERLRTAFPVAMIDEFQDTDPLQYQIFSDVYLGQPSCGLFMIGDPKQAIYAFRGADIFTYIHARRQVRDHYNLGTNWRSGKAVVEAVNAVFEVSANPFIYQQDIPFIPVDPAPGSESRGWQISGNEQPALTVWYPEHGEPVTKGEYFSVMAAATAAQTQMLLEGGRDGTVLIDEKAGKQRPVCPSDIAVLVRTGREATLVRDALAKQGIASVYLSNRDSVFASPVATDVLRILTATLIPDNESYLRAALATSLFAHSAEELDRLNYDESSWEKAVVAFSRYRQIWQSRGVLPMLRNLIGQRKIAERLLRSLDGERQLTDLLHVGELLQQASQELDSDHALVRWLSERIAEPNGNAEEQQVRLESERELVQIVTIHKSKGLEYPFVMLPFICSFRSSSQPFYHDEQNIPVLELGGADEAKEKAEQERLAEDLRLLYVALTRAVYGCFAGIAPLKVGRGASAQTSAHQCAVGYLLQNGEAGDASLLQAGLAKLTSSTTAVCVPPVPVEQRWQPAEEAVVELNAAVFDNQIDRRWLLTSYSGLLRQGHSHDPALATPAFDVDGADIVDNDEVEEEAVRDIFHFPRGARPGTFLHTLFERIDFGLDMAGEEASDMILQQLALENYEPEWLPVLSKMMTDVLHTPLDGKALKLADIPAARRLTELEFVMEIDSLNATRLNPVLAKYDPLSAQAGTLDFNTVSGMLKGFIDLVFEYQGRYFVLDWKSNYLGPQPQDYHPDAMAGAMLEHRYDFQYHIYSLALHLYLKSRIPDYDYDTHFGGVYYLFLRGIDGHKTDTGLQGVFTTRPEKALIEELEDVFRGQ